MEKIKWLKEIIEDYIEFSIITARIKYGKIVIYIQPYDLWKITQHNAEITPVAYTVENVPEIIALLKIFKIKVQKGGDIYV